MASSGVAASHNVVKAGWMQRESDMLKRWKQCYCVLKTNGLLSYFTNETQMEAQGHINLPRECFVLKVGRDVGSVAAPQGRTLGCLIEIRTSQASIIFCAESDDEAQTWKLVIDDIIRAHRRAPNPAAAPNPVTYTPPPVYMAGPGSAPPPSYTVTAPPTYSVTPAPVTMVVPGSTSHVTSTTYYPDGRTVTTRRGSPACYPVQQTVYSYPGQTVYSYPGQTVYSCPGQTLLTPGVGSTITTYQVPQPTTQVYQTRYY